MKKSYLSFGMFGLLFVAFLCLSAKMISTPLPQVELTDLDDKAISSETLNNNGKPYVVVLWATWQKHSVFELNELDEIQEEWKEKLGAKIIIVSIDDARNASKVKPFIEGKEWTFEAYKDVSQKFKTALKAETVPMTYVVNSKNEIVWSQTSYEEGDFEKIFAQLKMAK